MASSISKKDYDVLQSILKTEVNRYSRNPTTYFSNLVQRGIDIISENISEDAPPVLSDKKIMYI